MDNKKREKKTLNWKKIILLIIALHIGKTFLGQGILIRDLRNQRLQEKQEISLLKEEIKELEGEIETKGSLTFVEKVAREDFGMVRPREIIYIDNNKNKGNFIKFRK